MAISNTERQRQFRERNPGYYQRLHAKRSAAAKALREAMRHEQRVKAWWTQRPPLMLPAPVETIEIPGMTTLRGVPEIDAIKAKLVAARAHPA